MTRRLAPVTVRKMRVDRAAGKVDTAPSEPVSTRPPPTRLQSTRPSRSAPSETDDSCSGDVAAKPDRPAAGGVSLVLLVGA